MSERGFFYKNDKKRNFEKMGTGKNMTRSAGMRLPA
jgi:hypothetical protein